jgi:hypothetical protein
MSLLMCYLAVEKPCDGKPYTICEVSTWFNVGVFTLKNENRITNAKKLFEVTGTGQDNTERGVTKQELMKLIPLSNGGIYLIPKEANDFIKLKEV